MLIFCQNSFIRETTLITIDTYQMTEVKVRSKTKMSTAISSSVVRRRSMYFNKAIAFLTYGALLSLLSIGIMAWAPRSAVLIMFGSGVFLLAFGWVITLFIAFSAVMDPEVTSLEWL
jgi:hypothetical protein